MTAEVKVVKSSGYKERGREDIIYNTKSSTMCCAKEISYGSNLYLVGYGHHLVPNLKGI